MKQVQFNLSQKNLVKGSSIQVVQNQVSTHHFKSDKKATNSNQNMQQTKNTKNFSECSTMDVQTHQEFYLQQQFLEAQTIAQTYKKCVQWMVKNQRRLKIRIQTFYLAISYLIKFISMGGRLLQQNYQKVGVVMMLLSSKINEIYKIQFEDILQKCNLATTKAQLIELESKILFLFNFQVTFQENCYSIIKNSIAYSQNYQRAKNAQKILFMSIFQFEAFQFGEESLAYAIIYLIYPSFFLGLNLSISQVSQTKQIASKVRSFNQYVRTI